MDDGEVELSEHVLLSNSDSSSNNNIHVAVSVDSFLDELLRNAQTCTHTHTCNPPGPDAAHTHTCYHTHTQVIPSEKSDDVPNDSKNLTPRTTRSSGNREAVRKYREKKKAHSAYLEEEVKKLRFVNQQLIRKVQRQTILEAEILRLRGLLVELRGKIDNELVVFPFQKHCNSSTVLTEEDCGVQFTGGAAMGLPRADDIDGCNKKGVHLEGNCLPSILNCQNNAEKCGMNSMETLVSSGSPKE